MTATVAEDPDLAILNDDQLAGLYERGDDETRAAVLAEGERRDRADRARAAARRRHSEWEAAAYAQYEAAEARCRGNMLSEAGKRAGRDPWPMLWQGSEETARLLASDELITFWDYESPRVPGPGEYATAKRSAAAEQEARERDALGIEDPPERKRAARVSWERCKGGCVRTLSVRLGRVPVTAWAARDATGTISVHPSRAAAERHLAPPEPASEPEPEPRPAVPPGAMGRYITMLRITRRELDQTARSLGRMNGGIRP